MAHIWMSHVKHKTSHGTHKNESWHTYEWASQENASSSHLQNESWYTYEWVMAQIRMSHGTHMIEPTKRVPLLLTCRMSHGTHMNESWHTYDESFEIYEWVMSHIWMSHGTHMSRLRALVFFILHSIGVSLEMCHLTHSLGVSPDSFSRRVTWLIL